MSEQWVNLGDLGFTEYSVSDLGRVKRDATERIVKATSNTTGYLQVGLYCKGVRKKIGLNRLVAHAFLLDPVEDHFNVLLHKDGNRINCSAANLIWRPRWFAIKYHQQFEGRDEYQPVDIVREVNSGRMYASVKDVVVEHGLLYIDLLNSMTAGTSPMFADGRVFKYNSEL